LNPTPLTRCPFFDRDLSLPLRFYRPVFDTQFGNCLACAVTDVIAARVGVGDHD
jgi:hypothetical protein